MAVADRDDDDDAKMAEGVKRARGGENGGENEATGEGATGAEEQRGRE